MKTIFKYKEGTVSSSFLTNLKRHHHCKKNPIIPLCAVIVIAERKVRRLLQWKMDIYLDGHLLNKLEEWTWAIDVRAHSQLLKGVFKEF